MLTNFYHANVNLQTGILDIQVLFIRRFKGQCHDSYLFVIIHTEISPNFFVFFHLIQRCLTVVALLEQA